MAGPLSAMLAVRPARSGRPQLGADRTGERRDFRVLCACRRHFRRPLHERGLRHVPLEKGGSRTGYIKRSCLGRGRGSQRRLFGGAAARSSFWPGAALARLAGGEGWGGANRSESEAMSDARSELTVSLWRGAQQGRYQTYRVPLRENQTVLDVVTFVQRHLDPTLSYRFACRVGVCGSCAMTVNGRPRWTCRTHVSSVAKAGRLEIGPLENLPVIKDLATDM